MLSLLSALSQLPQRKQKSHSEDLTAHKMDANMKKQSILLAHQMYHRKGDFKKRLSKVLDVDLDYVKHHIKKMENARFLLDTKHSDEARLKRFDETGENFTPRPGIVAKLEKILKHPEDSGSAVAATESKTVTENCDKPSRSPVLCLLCADYGPPTESISADMHVKVMQEPPGYPDNEDIIGFTDSKYPGMTVDQWTTVQLCVKRHNTIDYDVPC